ncbi:MAG: DNA gyrase subunit A, partial [Gemmatimonadetes bacterium]|nr:DNA gyrase subunit A [Gemmatimonadota bacterium]
GLKIAVDNIDEVVAIIRGSPDTEQASLRLQERFGLSDRQAQAILDMRLGRLTGLEMDKLDQELSEVRGQIAELERILASREVRMGIVKDELTDVATRFGDDRRTDITDWHGDLDMEDLIADEEMVITVTRQGYIKRLPIDTYRAQRRGGRGLQGMGTKDEDWVEHLFVGSSHDYLMVFTRTGQCYWIKVWQLPEAGRHSRGKPIVNLLEMGAHEAIAAVVPVREFSDDRYLFFCTRNGQIKKTALSAYGNVRSVGLNAMNVREGDELIDVHITSGEDQIVLATRNGMAIRFDEQDTRPMGRATEGVRGIALRDDDHVVGMVVVPQEAGETTLLVATESGMGKRSDVDEYRLQGRGGFGVINIKTSTKTGKVVSIKAVQPANQVMIITRGGVVNRQRVDEIRVIGRATQGVRLINLDDGDTVVDVARLVVEDDDDEEQDGVALDGEADALPEEGVSDAGDEDADAGAEEDA